MRVQFVARADGPGAPIGWEPLKSTNFTMAKREATKKFLGRDGFKILLGRYNMVDVQIVAERSMDRPGWKIIGI